MKWCSETVCSTYVSANFCTNVSVSDVIVTQWDAFVTQLDAFVIQFNNIVSTCNWQRYCKDKKCYCKCILPKIVTTNV